MCTLALYFKQLKHYPLVVAANRDEFLSRPSGPPQILVDSPRVFGGKDLLAGGTWLGVNEHGLVAGILNRRPNGENSQQAFRSRGLLCLDVLRSKDPAGVCGFLKQESGSCYRPFNLLFANATEACVAYNVAEEIRCVKLEKGLHVLSNSAIFDPRSAKLDHAHTLFLRARRQVLEALSVSPKKSLAKRRMPAEDQVSCVRLFKKILGNHTLGKGSKDPKGALCVHAGDYGTVSSTVIFYNTEERQFSCYHAPASPCRSGYERFRPVAVL